MKVTKRQISMLLRTYFWCLQIFSAASQCLTFRRLYFVFTFTEVQPGINIATLCGNKMPTRCNRGFYCRSYCLLNIFRCITMPIIRSSRVLYRSCCLQTGHITLSSTPDQQLENHRYVLLHFKCMQLSTTSTVI